MSTSVRYLLIRKALWQPYKHFLRKNECIIYVLQVKMYKSRIAQYTIDFGDFTFTLSVYKCPFSTFWSKLENGNIAKTRRFIIKISNTEASEDENGKIRHCLPDRIEGGKVSAIWRSMTRALIGPCRISPPCIHQHITIIGLSERRPRMGKHGVFSTTILGHYTCSRGITAAAASLRS